MPNENYVSLSILPNFLSILINMEISPKDLLYLFEDMIKIIDGIEPTEEIKEDIKIRPKLCNMMESCVECQDLLFPNIGSCIDIAFTGDWGLRQYGAILVRNPTFEIIIPANKRISENNQIFKSLRGISGLFKLYTKMLKSQLFYLNMVISLYHSERFDRIKPNKPVPHTRNRLKTLGNMYMPKPFPINNQFIRQIQQPTAEDLAVTLKTQINTNNSPYITWDFGNNNITTDQPEDLTVEAV